MAAASASPRTRTASTSTVETVRGTHAFKIAGYSLHRGLGVDKFASSSTFVVGGYSWCIRFYPDGRFNKYPDYVALSLELMTTDAEVRASFEFRLLDQVTSQSTVVVTQVTPPLVFSTKAGTGGDGAIRFPTWTVDKAKNRTELEASAFLHDDCLVIECDVIVVVNEQPRAVEETAIPITPSFEVPVPPSNMSENLGKLLEEKKGADVAFKVGDEVFDAHKILLAARSPVFDAELFGSMAENTSGQRCIVIEDMHPDVFRALLHFIYTDTMPPPDMGELDDDGNEMTRHLLMAADRYGMERLKVMCEAILCESIDVDNVAILLALADQHHCRALGDACAEFIAASSNRMGNVVASQGYVRLKRACPDVLVDVLERVVTKCSQKCKK